MDPSDFKIKIPIEHEVGWIREIAFTHAGIAQLIHYNH
jgi:hypothetical protein